MSLRKQEEEFVEYEDGDGNMYTIVVGKNAQNNWDIIDDAEQNDIWFHVEGQPSCHVIIQVDDNKTIPKRVINFAAALCKENSKARFAKKAKIIYTQIKNVKKGTAVGSVKTSKTTQVIV